MPLRRYFVSTLTDKLCVACGVFALAILSVYGTPYLDSDISSISGELCPRTVTFTCRNTTQADSSINWFRDETIISRYSYNPSDTFPQNVSVKPGLEVLVQIEFANFNSGLYMFENWTLSSNLQNLHPLVGQSISCGSLVQKSNSIRIENYTIIDESDSLTVNTSVTYSGSTNQLQQINVTWNIVMCKNISNYTVELYSNTEVMINRTVRSTDECIEGKCEVVFLLKNGNFNFKVVIVARSQNLNVTDNIYSSTIIMGTTPNILQVDGCMASINCSGFNNTNCLVSNDSNNFMDPYTLQSTDVYSFSLDVDIKDVKTIEVRTLHNSVMSIIIYRLEDYSIYRRNEAAVGIGAAMYAIAICFIIAACTIEIFWIRKTKERSFQAILLIFGAILLLLLIITLAIWITVGVGYSAVSCSDEESNGQIFMWTAFGLSLLLLALSVVFLGSVLLFNGVHRKNKPEAQPTPLAKPQYSFDFFMENLEVHRSRQCYDCKTELFISKVVDPKYCHGCGQQLCRSCSSKNKVFIGRTFEHDFVCKTCNEIYIKDNEQLKTTEIKIICEYLRRNELCGGCQGKVVGQVQEQESQEDVKEGDRQTHDNQQGNIPKPDQEKRCCECNNVLCSTRLCYNQQVKNKSYCALCFILKKRKEDTCKENGHKEDAHKEDPHEEDAHEEDAHEEDAHKEDAQKKDAHKEERSTQL